MTREPQPKETAAPHAALDEVSQRTAAWQLIAARGPDADAVRDGSFRFRPTGPSCDDQPRSDT